MSGERSQHDLFTASRGPVEMATGEARQVPIAVGGGQVYASLLQPL